MGGFKLKSKNSKPFNKTQNYLIHASKVMARADLDEYGRMGVVALAAATPKASGESSSSWGYTIKREKGTSSIIFTNDNVVGESTVPVVILLQYGHLSKAGIYIEGYDFINPALRPVFESIRDKIWLEVNKH